MWELTMQDDKGNAVTYWCQSQLVALKRARQYVTSIGGIAVIRIQPANRSKPDDRRAA